MSIPNDATRRSSGPSFVVMVKACTPQNFQAAPMWWHYRAVPIRSDAWFEYLRW
jgi:hypothetical protein